jgi:hypothetical protein
MTSLTFAPVHSLLVIFDGKQSKANWDATIQLHTKNSFGCPF